jgi:hypothetical protein
MNAFSKTEQPCDCGWIATAINDPSSGISFDPAARKVTLAGNYYLYHCPFCGGRFPDSSKPISVPIFSPEERERLELLTKDLTTPEQVIQRLGPPDYNQPMLAYREHEGKMVHDESIPPVRNLEYYHLSDIAKIEFYFRADGSMDRRIMVKSLPLKHL